MGMHPDTKAFETWLTGQLKQRAPHERFNLNKQAKIDTIFFWLGVSLTVTGLVYLVVSVKTDIFNPKVNIVVSGIILLIGLILAAVFGVLWHVHSDRKFSRQHGTYNTYQFYNVFWEKCYQDKIPLTFEKLQCENDTTFTFYTPNDEKITWTAWETTDEEALKGAINVATDAAIGISGLGVGNQLKIKTAYVLRTELKAYSNQLTNCEGILLTKRFSSSVPKVGNAYDLATPSISFNTKFKITTLSENQHAAARIFDPSVVQFFDEMNYVSAHFDLLEFHNDAITIQWRDQVRNHDQRKHCLNNFDWVVLAPWNTKRAAQKITKKIQEDYEWFFENLAMLQPFGLYQF